MLHRSVLVVRFVDISDNQVTNSTECMAVHVEVPISSDTAYLTREPHHLTSSDHSERMQLPILLEGIYRLSNSLNIYQFEKCRQKFRT